MNKDSMIFFCIHPSVIIQTATLVCEKFIYLNLTNTWHCHSVFPLSIKLAQSVSGNLTHA